MIVPEPKSGVIRLDARVLEWKVLHVKFLGMALGISYQGAFPVLLVLVGCRDKVVLLS